MTMQLTQGCLQATYEAQGDVPGHEAYPDAIVQVLSIKQISPPGTGPLRYRFIISDGLHYVQAMLSSQLNDLVTQGVIKKNGIIKMTQYLCNTVQVKRIFILLSMEVLTPQQENIPKQGAPVGLGVGESANRGATNSMPPNNPGAQPPQQQNMNPGMQPGYRGQMPSNSSMNNITSAGYGQQGQQHNAGYGQQSSMAPSKQGVSGYGGPPPNNIVPPRPMHGDAPTTVFPIKSLSPYQNKWTIKARCVSKSDVKHWSNQRGEGKLFSCTFVDDSGEIRATAFNDAVTAFYDVLQEGQVYYVSRAPIKVAKKQFSNVNNDYEMSIDPGTVISPCSDTSDVPNIRFSFIELSRLFEVEPNTNVDVIGVVRDASDVSELISKNTNKPFKKRELTLVDASQYEVRLTLFGRQAETFDTTQDCPVAAFKGVQVRDFGGRTLSMGGSSTMMMNPDVPEARHLRGWYDAEGRTQSFQSYSSDGAGAGAAGRKDVTKFISQIKDENLGTGEKPDYFAIRATIMFIRTENVWYPACPADKCNKKVTDVGNGWRCEKCDKTWPSPSYRYILSFNVADHTGQTWVQTFNESAEQLLGKKADEMVQLRDMDSKAADEVFNAATFKTYSFKLRAKSETYQDEVKVRSSVMSFAPIDYGSSALALAEAIEQYKSM